MGMLYKKQSKFERSLDAYTRCLKIREEQVGEDHPDTCAVRHNIAELYVMWAKPDKAKEFISRNIEVMEKRTKEDKEMADEVNADSPTDKNYFNWYY